MTIYGGSANQVDLEEILDRIVLYFQTNLNGILGEIDTWKADAITLKTVNSGAFYIGLEKGMFNFDPFLTFDIFTKGVESNTGLAHAKELIIPILIYKADTNDGNLWRHFLRYQKALVACMERYRDIPTNAIMGMSHLEISEVDRYYLSNEDGTTIEREAIGIVVSGNLG